MQEVYIVQNKAMFSVSSKSVIVCDIYEDAKQLAISINDLQPEDNVDEYIIPCPGYMHNQTFNIQDIISTAVVATKSALNRSANE